MLRLKHPRNLNFEEAYYVLAVRVVGYSKKLLFLVHFCHILIRIWQMPSTIIKTVFHS